MVSFGRIVCVALPFILAVGSLIAMLVAGLAGVGDKNLYLFELDMENLNITADMLKQLASSLTPRDSPSVDLLGTKIDKRVDAGDVIDAAGAAGAGQNAGDAAGAVDAAAAASNVSIKATDLGLDKLYDINVMNYCFISQDDKKTCTKPKFNWAEDAMKNFTQQFEAVAGTIGVAANTKIELPKEVKEAMNIFATVAKWTQIVYVIAFVALALEIFFGFLSNCSRSCSCLTWIIAIFAAIATGAAAGLSTAMASVVVGVVEGTAKAYGVKGQINLRFLAAVWIGFALALIAAFFWLFTICCCKPESRSRGGGGGGGSKHLDESSAYMSGPYQPLHDPEHDHNGFYNPNRANTHSGGSRFNQGDRSNLAYEPYSHQ